MTGYLRKSPVSQITEILHDGRLYEAEEIKKALKAIPKQTKKKGKK